MQKAIAIDFDGCLCENKYPKIGKPFFVVIEAAKEEQSKGAGLRDVSAPAHGPV